MSTLTVKQAAFMREIRGSTCRRNIESMFLYHASPILRNVKPAVLITVNPECMPTWMSCRNAMCRATGLHMKEIVRATGSTLILIYDNDALAKAMNNEISAGILKRFAYPINEGIDACLVCLAERLGESSFPHEVGIFLGYPPGDVKGFIDNNGKNSTCCRYWKVYENVEAAQAIWKKIEEAYQYAMVVIECGSPIHVAAGKLKLCA